MKNILISCGAAIVAGLFFVSCSKDFLDPEVTDYVTGEHLAEMRQDPAQVSALSKASIAAAYNDFQVNWNGRVHDSFGMKAFQLQSDLLTEDMPYVGKLNWFQYDYLLDMFAANYYRTSVTWDAFYDVVSICNIMLRDYFSDETTDETILALKAEPLAVRAIAFFYLVNFYQVNYFGHENAMGVPLTLSPDDGNLPRASVKEVYDQIIKDLTFAVENGVVTPDHTDVDKAVAATYLAKAYATMNDWPNVEKYARIAQEEAKDIAPKLPMGWDIGNDDVLWGFDITANTNNYWASFYAQMDPTAGYYASNGQTKGIYTWLYHQMGVNDVRRTLFVDNKLHPEIAGMYPFPSEGITYTNFDEVVYEKDAEGNDIKDKPQIDKETGDTVKISHNYDYTALKFVTSEGSLTDYIYLRVQDPILLEIEAINEQGRTADAAAKLNAFMKKRDPDFVAKMDQGGLREQIRINRRIELWGEGSTWFDFRRWDIPCDRSKSVTLPDGTVVKSNHKLIPEKPYSFNDINYVFMLPQREVNNNKELKQDPRD